MSAQPTIAQDLKDSVRERVRRVPNEDVLAVHGVETLAADRRRNDCFAHRPCVEDFEAGSPADADRHDAAQRFRERWPNVGNVSQRHYAGLGIVARLVRRFATAD